MNLWQLLTAITPVASVFLLLVMMRMPASRAMPLSLLVSGLLAWLMWQVPGRQIAASVLKAG
jgi:lactate permease